LSITFPVSSKDVAECTPSSPSSPSSKDAATIRIYAEISNAAGRPVPSITQNKTKRNAMTNSMGKHSHHVHRIWLPTHTPSQRQCIQQVLSISSTIKTMMGLMASFSCSTCLNLMLYRTRQLALLLPALIREQTLTFAGAVPWPAYTPAPQAHPH